MKILKKISYYFNYLYLELQLTHIIDAQIINWQVRFPWDEIVAEKRFSINGHGVNQDRSAAIAIVDWVDSTIPRYISGQ